MTYPITPNPAIHDGRAGPTALTDPSAVLNNITSLFQEIPQIIINGAIAFIKQETGIDLTGVEQFFDSFETAISNGGAGALAYVQSILKPLTDALGTVLGHPLPQLDNVVNTLASFLGNTNIVANAANALAGVANAAAGAANSLASAAENAANQAGTLIQQVIDIIAGALRGIPFVGGTAADLLEALDGFTQGVTQQQIIQQNVTTSAAQITRQPNWASESAISIQSYPAFMNTEMDVFSSAGVANGMVAGAGIQAVPQFGSVGAYLGAEEDNVFSGFSFVAKANFTPPAGSVWLEIWREATPDFALSTLIRTDISALLSTKLEIISATWGGGVTNIVKRGERNMMRIVNSSSPDCGVQLKGFPWAPGTPFIQFSTTGATQTNVTSYSSADALAIINSATFTPWFEMTAEESDIPQAATWQDTFDRPVLGYFWSHQQNAAPALTIVNNQLAYSGTVNGSEQEIHIRTLFTPQFKLEASVVGVNSTTARILFWMASSREATTGVILSLSKGAAEIYTAAGTTTANTLATQRAIQTWSGGDGDFTFTYTQATNTYEVLLGGNPIGSGLKWTDTGNIMVPFQTPANTYGQVQIQRAAGVNAGTVDSWLIQDW